MPAHPCVFVNEPKLLDLKMILIRQHGLKAEFVNGVLICEDTVAIKRVSHSMEGSSLLLTAVDLERSRQDHSRRISHRYLLQSSTNFIRSICDSLMIVQCTCVVFFFLFSYEYRPSSTKVTRRLVTRSPECDECLLGCYQRPSVVNERRDSSRTVQHFPRGSPRC